MIAWLGVQLLCIGLAAAQTRYWANFPRPAERMATAELLVVQFVFAALLGPVLLSRWGIGLMATIAAIPFAYLGAGLSAQMWPPRTYSMICGVEMWLLGLIFLNHIMRWWNRRGLGVAIGLLLALLGPLLNYLSADFGENSNGGGLIGGAIGNDKFGPRWRGLPSGPLSATFELFRNGVDDWRPWKVNFGVLLVFAILFGAVGLWRLRQARHPGAKSAV
jgi:hypothetical protein